MDNGAGCYRRFLEGDNDALAELIRLYRDGLTLYLNGITQDIFAAEELAEEVFVRLVVKRPRFSGKSSFKTWLFAIGRHAAADELRQRSRLSGSPPEEDCAREEESLEQACFLEERQVAVRRALQALNPDYRQALLLTYFEDFTNDETARIMGKSKRQVENLLYNARRALKARLEKEGSTFEEL